MAGCASVETMIDELSTRLEGKEWKGVVADVAGCADAGLSGSIAPQEMDDDDKEEQQEEEQQEAEEQDDLEFDIGMDTELDMDLVMEVAMTMESSASAAGTKQAMSMWAEKLLLTKGVSNVS